MPPTAPTLDVYVWVAPEDRAHLGAVVFRFVDDYLNTDTAPTDTETLDSPDDPSAGTQDPVGTVLRVTPDGCVVLGVSIADPEEPGAQAHALLETMCDDFGAVAGIAGIDLPAPTSRHEWDSAGVPLVRRGTL